jgi:antitoxin CptB
MAGEQSRGSAVAEDLTLRRKRALYRAQHRGTKEMDWMVGRFAEARLGDMSVDQLSTFEEFIEIGDPELNGWLLDPARCNEPTFASLVKEIRVFNSLS